MQENELAHYLNLLLVFSWNGIESEALKRVIDYDINMVDACLNTTALSANEDLVSTTSKYKNICGGDLTSVDGITKASILKDEKDINRGSVKVRIVLGC